MTTFIAVSRVHYGIDYLEWVCRSTAGFADIHLVLYTDVPTFGHGTNLPNPDRKEDLYAAARRGAGDRLHWVEKYPTTIEAAHRLHPEADLILELDADEVIDYSLLADIERAYHAGELEAGKYRLPMSHYWRSFDWRCEDSNWPVRLYQPRIKTGEAYWHSDKAGRFTTSDMPDP